MTEKRNPDYKAFGKKKQAQCLKNCASFQV